MFTGIIEELGDIQAIKLGSVETRITIHASKVLEDTKLGDSIAVNGVCLTVVAQGNHFFQADVMNETLKRSNLGNLHRGDQVNLERALCLNSRLGGHLVSGHIDGIGEIVSIKRDANAVWYEIKTADTLLKYIIEKGSIAIDGISLTVAAVNETAFKVSVIPHTMIMTTLKQKTVADKVNLECDMIGKYVERLCRSEQQLENKTNNGMTMDFLLGNGF